MVSVSDSIKKTTTSETWRHHQKYKNVTPSLNYVPHCVTWSKTASCEERSARQPVNGRTSKGEGCVPISSLHNWRGWLLSHILCYSSSDSWEETGISRHLSDYSFSLCWSRSIHGHQFTCHESGAVRLPSGYASYHLVRSWYNKSASGRGCFVNLRYYCIWCSLQIASQRCFWTLHLSSWMRTGAI